MLQGKRLIKATCDYLREGESQNLSKTTLSGRRKFLNRFLRFVGGRVLSLNIAKEYLESLQQSGWQVSSRNDEIKKIRAFDNFLIKRKYTREKLDLPFMKCPRRLFDLIAPELLEKAIFAGSEPGPFDNRLVQEVKRDARLALRFALRTGLRVSELCSLRGCDLRLEDAIPNFSVVSKGRNQDLLPAPKDLIPELKPRLNNERLFRITPPGLNTILQRGGKKVGIQSRLHVHLLRHAFCTALLRRGTSLPIVQRLMRHHSVEITNNTYAHYILEDLAGPINSQPIVRDQLTPAEVLAEAERAIKKIVGNDKRLEITTTGQKIEVEILA